MLEFRFRHWSHREAGLLARMLHSIFSIVKEQHHYELRIINFEFHNSKFAIPLWS
jgi:hypothetical protein